jgi:thiamine pyrophosphokinase
MNNQIHQMLDTIYPVDDYVAIVAHGEFPKNYRLIELIKSAKTIVCCDGAITNLLAHNITPDYIIGDCDSLPTQILTDFADKIIKIPEQQNNDLTKAVNFTIEKLQENNIIIFAATGLREDHTIGNIGLLAKYSHLTKQIAIVSDYGIFTVHSGNNKIQTISGQQISIFSTTPNIRLNSKGLVWELNDFQLDFWYYGTLNQVVGDCFELGSNGLVIIYRAFEVKN